MHPQKQLSCIKYFSHFVSHINKKENWRKMFTVSNTHPKQYSWNQVCGGKAKIFRRNERISHEYFSWETEKKKTTTNHYITHNATSPLSDIHCGATKNFILILLLKTHILYYLNTSWSVELHAPCIGVCAPCGLTLIMKVEHARGFVMIMVIKDHTVTLCSV